MNFPIHGSAKSTGRHAQKRHAAPKAPFHREKAIKISKTLPAVALALLLAGSSTAMAVNGNTSSMLPATQLNSSSAAGRDSSRSLLSEQTQLSVDGTFTTGVDENNVIIEAPLTQDVQEARATLQNTISSATSTLQGGQSYASASDLSTLQGLIDQANSVVANDNATTDEIYAINSSLAQSANTVNSAIVAGKTKAAASTTAPTPSTGTQSTGQPAASPSTTVPVTAGSGTGQDVANLAIQYLGVPYVSGGNTPSGWDCSGYVQWLYAQFGVSLAHSSGVQAQTGTYIGGKADLSKAQPGDIVANGMHAAIYVGGGNCAQAMNPSLGTGIYPCDAVTSFASGYSIRRIFN